MCGRKRPILVLNSYLEAPLSLILYPPLNLSPPADFGSRGICGYLLRVAGIVLNPKSLDLAVLVVRSSSPHILPQV